MLHPTDVKTKVTDEQSAANQLKFICSALGKAARIMSVKHQGRLYLHTLHLREMRKAKHAIW